MSRLFYLECSPRGEHSKSSPVAKAFLLAHRQIHPDDEVVHRNVFDMALPVFDGAALEAKYSIMHGKPHTHEQLTAWRSVETVIADFKAADKYLLSVPMWNFGVPYRLKHYLDVIVQPGYTFSYSPEAGFGGLVRGKPLLIIYARGSEYTSAGMTPLDFQKPYLETILGFIGFRDIQSIIVEPTEAAGREVAQQHVQAAQALAEKLAGKF